MPETASDLTLEWVACQVQHPKKGVMDARQAEHPVAGTLFVYPLNTAMGMWGAYAPDMPGTPQHFLGVFTEDRFDKNISDAAWLEAQKQVKAADRAAERLLEAG